LVVFLKKKKFVISRLVRMPFKYPTGVAARVVIDSLRGAVFPPVGQFAGQIIDVTLVSLFPRDDFDRESHPAGFYQRAT
jgi:hypothetical protein